MKPPREEAEAGGDSETEAETEIDVDEAPRSVLVPLVSISTPLAPVSRISKLGAPLRRTGGTSIVPAKRSATDEVDEEETDVNAERVKRLRIEQEDERLSDQVATRFQRSPTAGMRSVRKWRNSVVSRGKHNKPPYS